MTRLVRNRDRHAGHCGSGGQALLEFALIVPIFLFVLFGILDMGRYVYSHNAVGQAAREAARANSVSIRPSCTGLSREACVDRVARASLSIVPLSSITVTATCERIAANGTRSSVPMATCRSNDLLDVSIQAPFQAWTPLIATLVGTPTMAASARVTVNQ